MLSFTGAAAPGSHGILISESDREARLNDSRLITWKISAVMLLEEGIKSRYHVARNVFRLIHEGSKTPSFFMRSSERTGVSTSSVGLKCIKRG